jgi:hypothetical protein
MSHFLIAVRVLVAMPLAIVAIVLWMLGEQQRLRRERRRSKQRRHFAYSPQA